MSHTAKLVEARDRIKAFAMKKRDDTKRLSKLGVFGARVCARRDEANGLDLAVRVIEDLLQD